YGSGRRTRFRPSLSVTFSPASNLSSDFVEGPAMRLKMLRVLPAALAVSVSASVFADSQVATSDVAVLRLPTLTPQLSGTLNRLQAVSPVNSRLVWASGVGVTYVVTTDGGAPWRRGVVQGDAQEQ